MSRFKLCCLLLITLMISSTLGQTQLSSDSFRAFDASGKEVKLDQIVSAIETADVVFLGEQHDDPTAHGLQLEIFTAAFARYGKTRSVVLSLEMFERDVQLVLDEYLADLINENNFISSSRAWNNYKTDYRPLVEFAKQNKLPVIAANAPRRYVNRVSRLGSESLNQLSPAAKTWIAPLPFAAASNQYAAKFNQLFGNAAHGGNAKMLSAQSLWDATMAFSIAESLKKHRNAAVIHLNGGFHSENRLGTPEHLLQYAPKTRFLVVNIKSSPKFPNFDKESDENGGDFVILTDPKLPRSGK